MMSLVEAQSGGRCRPFFGENGPMSLSLRGMSPDAGGTARHRNVRLWPCLGVHWSRWRHEAKWTLVCL